MRVQEISEKDVHNGVSDIAASSKRGPNIQDLRGGRGVQGVRVV